LNNTTNTGLLMQIACHGPRVEAAILAGRAPGRPKPAASRETRLALMPSKSAQADLEPRHSEPESFSGVPEQRAKSRPI